MKIRIWIAVIALGMVSTTDVQHDAIGEVIPVLLTSGSAAVTLDFTDLDYALVLYAVIHDMSATSWPLHFLTQIEKAVSPENPGRRPGLTARQAMHNGRILCASPK